MNKVSADPGFESYRRERQRRKNQGPKEGQPDAPDALKELLEVEAREERDRVLTRDVQEFFDSATRVAANIVGRVATTEKSEVESKLTREMEEFLADALHRLEQVVVNVVARAQGPEAHKEVQPRMRNLVGQLLDDFRNAGTSSATKHLGQDPTMTDLDTVQAEFRANRPTGANHDGQLVPVSNLEAIGKVPPAHAATQGKPAADMEEHLVAQADKPPVSEPKTNQPMPAARRSTQAVAATKPTQPASKAPTQMTPELEQWKAYLTREVQQGRMTRDEARAAWQQRVRG
jgi:hypothetical protein